MAVVTWSGVGIFCTCSAPRPFVPWHVRGRDKNLAQYCLLQDIRWCENNTVKYNAKYSCNMLFLQRFVSRKLSKLRFHNWNADRIEHLTIGAIFKNVTRNHIQAFSNTSFPLSPWHALTPNIDAHFFCRISRCECIIKIFYGTKKIKSYLLRWRGSPAPLRPFPPQVPCCRDS